MTINLVVNGKLCQLETAATVSEYIALIGFDGRYVAVARNGDVLAREAFPYTTLAEGDCLEIVRPVGGG